jgi:hypothetical protein
MVNESREIRELNMKWTGVVSGCGISAKGTVLFRGKNGLRYDISWHVLKQSKDNLLANNHLYLRHFVWVISTQQFHGINQ